MRADTAFALSSHGKAPVTPVDHPPPMPAARYPARDVHASPDHPPHSWHSLVWWLPPSSRLAARAAFWFRYPVDRFGEPIHLALACLFCFAAAWPVSIAESAALALAICWLIRLPFLWRAHALLCRQWHFLLLLLLFLWHTLSLSSIRDVKEGIEQWGAFRYAALVPALYPLARHRGWLMLAAAAGFAVGALLQLVEAIAPSLIDVAWLEHRTPDGRVGGWWPPVLAGELLVGALAINAAALLHARSRAVAVIASLAAMLSLGGILLSGTRGAWIAAAVLLLVVLVVGFRTRVRSDVHRRVAIAAVAITIAVATVALLASDGGRRRLVDARNEVARLVERGESQTNIGLRARMLAWGWQAAMQHPVTGIGPGQFPSWVRQRTPMASGDELGAIEQFERERHGHCHNTPLEMAVAAGLPAVALLVVAVVACLAAGFRRGDTRAQGPSLMHAYAAAPAWLLLATVLLWPFDAVTVSVQPMMLMMLAAALCPGWLPAMPGDRPAATPAS